MGAASRGEIGAELAGGERQIDAGRGRPGLGRLAAACGIPDAVADALRGSTAGGAGAGAQPARQLHACPPGVPRRLWRAEERARRWGVLAAQAAAAAAERERVRRLVAARAEEAVAASCVAAEAKSAGESWALDAEKDAIAGRWAPHEPVPYAPTDSTDTTASDSDGPGGTWWARLGTAATGDAGSAVADDRDLADLPSGGDRAAAGSRPAAVPVGAGNRPSVVSGGGDAGSGRAPALPAPTRLAGADGGPTRVSRAASAAALVAAAARAAAAL